MIRHGVRQTVVPPVLSKNASTFRVRPALALRALPLSHERTSQHLHVGSVQRLRLPIGLARVVVSHKVADRESRRERGVRPLMLRCGRSLL